MNVFETMTNSEESLSDLRDDIDRTLKVCAKLRAELKKREKWREADQLLVSIKNDEIARLKQEKSPEALSPVNPTFVLTRRHLTLYELIQKRGIGGACNDLSSKEFDLLTEDEWYFLNYEYHKRNDDLDEYKQYPSLHMMDFAVVSVIRQLLLETYAIAHDLPEE